MRKKREWFTVIVLTLLLFALAACQDPGRPQASESSSPQETASPNATPALSLPGASSAPALTTHPAEDLQKWGYQPFSPYDREPIPSFDPTFYEELLPDQSYAVEAATKLYSTCYNLPPALASTVSAFPSITQTSHVRTSDPIEINRLMYTSANGGEIQAKLLEALKELLEGSGTDLEIVHVSGEVRFTQAYIDAEPVYEGYETLSLFWSDPVQVVDATQLKVTRNFADGSTEVGYFDFDTGLCRCVSNQDFPY